MNDFELRFCDAELRIGEGEKPKITGYAAVYGSLSVDLGGFREVINPGAFKAVANGADEMLAVVNHDYNKTVARRSAGTLTIREDANGLYVEVDPPNTTLGRDLVEDIRAKNIKGMSFRFRGAKDSWEKRDGQRVRVISDIGKVGEVTFTTIPAYEATTVELRSALEQLDKQDKATPRLDAAGRRLKLASLRK